MKNNLVPEQRTDKNGVLTTRWVKPSGFNVTNPLSIPEPTSPQAKAKKPISKSNLIEDISNRWVLETAEDMDGDEFNRELRTIRDQLSPYSVIALQDFALPTSSDENYVRFLGIQNLIRKGADTTQLRDFSHLSGLINDDPAYQENIDDFPKLMKVISSYPGLVPLKDHEEYPVQREQQCKALLRLTMWTDEMIAEGDLGKERMNVNNDTYSLQNAEMVNFLIADPDNAEQAMDFIEERGVDDVQLVKEFLDQRTLALSSGIL